MSLKRFMKRLRLAIKGDPHMEWLEDQVDNYARVIAKQSDELEWFALRADTMYELGAIGTPRDKFLNGLADLTRQTGVEIAGCGCCDSPFLMKAEDTHPQSGYVIDPGTDDETEYSGEHVEWCSPKRHRERSDSETELLPIYRGRQYDGPRETGEE